MRTESNNAMRLRALNEYIASLRSLVGDLLKMGNAAVAIDRIQDEIVNAMTRRDELLDVIGAQHQPRLNNWCEAQSLSIGIDLGGIDRTIVAEVIQSTDGICPVRYFELLNRDLNSNAA